MGLLSWLLGAAIGIGTLGDDGCDDDGE